MVDAYFLHTPASETPQTPEPSHLVMPEAGDEGLARREVVERTLELEQLQVLRSAQEEATQRAAHSQGGGTI